MDQLTPHDALRYEKLKQNAASDVLGFRMSARQNAQDYTRSMRRLLRPTDTRSTSTYLLLSEWETRIAPDIEALQKTRQATPLRTALAKHLLLSSQAANDMALRLVDERVAAIQAKLLDLCYGKRGKARSAAMRLFRLDSEQIMAIHKSFVAYELDRLVAHDVGVTLYDPNAPLIKRMFQAVAERRQVHRYKKHQANRLKAVLARQQELKAAHRAIISRILALELDTVLAIEAYRHYKKQLDKLQPESLTPAKRLSMFAAATKKIREAHTSKQSTTSKLADLQIALQSVDDVLVELFDMTDAQRNTLMTQLKEYRDLEREAARITKEQATYGA